MPHRNNICGWCLILFAYTYCSVFSCQFYASLLGLVCPNSTCRLYVRLLCATFLRHEMCFTTVFPNNNGVCYGWKDYFPIKSSSICFGRKPDECNFDIFCVFIPFQLIIQSHSFCTHFTKLPFNCTGGRGSTKVPHLMSMASVLAG